MRPETADRAVRDQESDRGRGFGVKARMKNLPMQGTAAMLGSRI